MSLDKRKEMSQCTIGQVGKRELRVPQDSGEAKAAEEADQRVTEAEREHDHKKTSSHLVVLQYFEISSHCTWSFASIIGKRTFIPAAYSSLAVRTRHSCAGGRYHCSTPSMGVGSSVARPMYLA